MGTHERRCLLMKKLCNQRYATIPELAAEFGVSERTIRRDIEVLSLTEPIYTQAGRYNGGVYVMDGYYPHKNYFTEEQTNVIKKVIQIAENGSQYVFSEKEINLLKDMLITYTKPEVKR